MLRMLTEKESKQHEKEMNIWWKNLDSIFRCKIYNCFKSLIGQVQCSHEWISNKDYIEKLLKEGSIDKKNLKVMTYCKTCGIEKPKD